MHRLCNYPYLLTYNATLKASTALGYEVILRGLNGDASYYIIIKISQFKIVILVMTTIK